MITTEHDGKKYRLIFHHSRQQHPMFKRGAPVLRYTAAVISYWQTAKENPHSGDKWVGLVSSKAWCSLADAYKRAEGREIALRRLVHFCNEQAAIRPGNVSVVPPEVLLALVVAYYGRVRKATEPRRPSGTVPLRLAVRMADRWEVVNAHGLAMPRAFKTPRVRAAELEERKAQREARRIRRAKA